MNSPFIASEASFYRVMTTATGLQLGFQVTPVPAGHLFQMFDEKSIYKSQVFTDVKEGQREATASLIAYLYQQINLNHEVRVTAG